MARQTRIVSFEDARNRSRRDERAQESRASSSRQRQAARKESSNEARRRERTKARADKMFAKQFGSDASEASQAEGAPRAAVYEGKMGKTHRRSSRMQQSKSSGAKSSQPSVSSVLSGITITSRSLKITTAVACVLLACLFLYTPAQQYYQAHRELDRLSVEYSSIEQRNDVLDAQNDALVSDAGMEDAVRQKYGYVRAGEETAVVTGLHDETTDTSRDSENIEANVLSSSVKAPEEWYTPFLDALFGVE